MQAYVLDSLPNPNTAEDFGTFRVVYLLIGSLFPLYGEFISEITIFNLAFLSLGLMLVLGLIVLFTYNRKEDVED